MALELLTLVLVLALTILYARWRFLLCGPLTIHPPWHSENHCKRHSATLSSTHFRPRTARQRVPTTTTTTTTTTINKTKRPEREENATTTDSINMSNPPSYETVVEGTTKEGHEKVALYDWLRQHAPNMFTMIYEPTPWLINGHLHTLYLERKEPNPFAEGRRYEREILADLPNGGKIALDWFWPVKKDKKGSGTTNNISAVIICLHGLSGGSHEAYICDTIKYTIEARDDWAAVVVNARGCGFYPIQNAHYYSASYTDDVRFVVKEIRKRYPDVFLGAVGFSLGSNILVKYLGEDGDAVPLDGAMGVGNPFDFSCLARHLENSWFNRTTYNRIMAGNLVKVFRPNMHFFKDHTFLDLDAAMKSPHIRWFDEHFVRRFHGFHSTDEYYRFASASMYLLNVSVPTFCLNSMDDPICTANSIPYGDISVNPNIVLGTTTTGGHLGWFTGMGRDPQSIFPGLCLSYFESLYKAKKEKVAWCVAPYQSVDRIHRQTIAGNPKVSGTEATPAAAHATLTTATLPTPKEEGPKEAPSPPPPPPAQLVSDVGTQTARNNVHHLATQTTSPARDTPRRRRRDAVQQTLLRALLNLLLAFLRRHWGTLATTALVVAKVALRHADASRAILRRTGEALRQRQRVRLGRYVVDGALGVWCVLFIASFMNYQRRRMNE